MDSLAFLDRADKGKAQPIYVLPGDEAFLKRQVKVALRRFILGDDDSGFGLAMHDGATATFGAVMNDVQTVALLTPQRLVIVEDADPFVTKERAKLEKYFAAPSSAGVLVLEVNAWTSTTRLAKMVPDAGTLVCKTPDARALPRWCIARCLRTYDKHLDSNAAQTLVELVGPDMGRLDMEMAKLSAYCADAKSIAATDVDKLVGQGRSEQTWIIFDMIGNGKIADALGLLGRLFDQGDEPLRLLGAFSMQLRRLVQALRLSEQGKSLPAALEQAGIPPFARRNAEQQLRYLGRRRLDRVYEWLVQTDLGMKSSNHLPERVLLERLVVRLARPAEPVKR